MLSEKIKQIIDARHGRDNFNGNGHLKAVTNMIGFITILKERLKEYQDFRAVVLSQIENKSGEYYQMSVNDPMFQQYVERASTEEVEKSIRLLDVELERLQKRFERETINISVVGKARQGKSRLLRSITGLDDDVIPTSDGGDCTGTTSVIYNSPNETEARATVIFFSEHELISHINRYIKELNFGPEIGSISQIPLLLQRVKDYHVPSKTAKEQSLFGHMRKYIEHYEDYKEFLGKTINIRQSEIRDYAAQYDMNFNATYKYLAVNKVEIFKKFVNADVGDIVLVDTIGLGDTALGIREKMIMTLRDDSDAAILVRLPSQNGDGIREDDDALFDLISEAMDNRQLSKWLFYALNIYGDGSNANAANAMKGSLESRSLSYAFIQQVNCSNSDEVNDKLLVPILDFLIDNIAEVDASLVEHANELLERVYNNYFNLCARVNSVVKGGLKGALKSGGLFDDLFESKLGLALELNKLNQAYSNLDSESTEIRSEVLKVLRGIANNIPTLQDIKNRLNSGGPDAYVENVYNFYADNVRASIRDSLDAMNTNVISGIQDKVKLQIIEVLRSDEGGRMARISLNSPNLDNPMQWLKSLIEEKTDDFEIIKTALNNIYDFRLNIEGLLEYKANLALSCYDQMSPDFARLPELAHRADIDTQAEIIRQTIIENVPVVANKLMESIVELLKIPVNSFNSHIRKLRERLIFKQEGRRELKNFYRENAIPVWPNEFAAIANEDTVTAGWSNITKQLEDLRDRNRFIITL